MVKFEKALARKAAAAGGTRRGASRATALKLPRTQPIRLSMKIQCCPVETAPRLSAPEVVYIAPLSYEQDQAIAAVVAAATRTRWERKVLGVRVSAPATPASGW